MAVGAMSRIRTWAIGLLNMLHVDTRELVEVGGDQEKSQGGEKANDAGNT